MVVGVHAAAEDLTKPSGVVHPAEQTGGPNDEGRVASK